MMHRTPVETPRRADLHRFYGVAFKNDYGLEKLACADIDGDQEPDELLVIGSCDNLLADGL